MIADGKTSQTPKGLPTCRQRSQCHVRSGDWANHLPSLKWAHFKYRAWHAEHKSIKQLRMPHQVKYHQWPPRAQTNPPRDRNFWHNTCIVLPTFYKMEQECLAQVHMEVAGVTTADLLGLQITERHQTAFFSFFPSTQRPENSLDWRSTVHSLFSLMNISSLAGLLTFWKWVGRAAAQTLA